MLTNVRLIVVGGDAKAAEITLKLPTVIGRGREASLTLPHPLVSRLHCEIIDDNNQLIVRDMGSLNGTFVNNHQITEPTELPSGDLLTIGTVTFRAVYETPGAESQPVTEDRPPLSVSEDESDIIFKNDVVDEENGSAIEPEDRITESLDEPGNTQIGQVETADVDEDDDGFDDFLKELDN